MVIWRWFTYLVSNYLQQIHLPLFMRPFFIFHTFAPDSRRRPSALARLTVRFSASPSRRSRPSWQGRPMAVGMGVNTTEMEFQNQKNFQTNGYFFRYYRCLKMTFPWFPVAICIIPRHTPWFFCSASSTSHLASFQPLLMRTSTKV